MDILIPVRADPKNEPLRFALRSYAANLPHGRVVIAGYLPAWLRNVEHIPVAQGGSKPQNSLRNLTTACRSVALSEDFVLSNDDIFVARPVDAVPMLHRGPINEVLAPWPSSTENRAVQRMARTRDLLIKLGHPNPLSYELHVPMPMTRAGFLELVDSGRLKPELNKRTLYGNWHQVGGRQVQDVQVMEAGPRFPRGPFLSTTPKSWAGAAGRYVRSLFPTRCRYELTD